MVCAEKISGAKGALEALIVRCPNLYDHYSKSSTMHGTVNLPTFFETKSIVMRTVV